jgi:hypothetical protein
VAVHIRLRSSCFFGETVMGGEKQRDISTYLPGYSETAQCIGKPSYLEPISGSLHVPIEGRVTIGEKHNQKHVENAARFYLDRIRNGMQKPIEGLPRAAQKIEEGSAIRQKHNQNHAENYLKGGYRQNGAQQSVLVVLFYAYHASVAFEVVADAFE